MKWIIPCLFLATTASASFSGYTYQRVITISSTNVSNVSGTVNNFPVVVSTNDVSLSTTTGSGGRLNSSGMDLIFSTMSDCSFNLKWDTETVQNVGISTFNAWVNIPVLTTATLTAATFYMCYGNSGITTYQGVSTATWDSNFVAVFHLASNPTLKINDSTSFQNNSSNINSMFVSTPAVISGGVGAHVSGIVEAGLTINPSNGINNLTNITWSTWVNPYSCTNIRADGNVALFGIGSGGKSFSFFNDCTLSSVIATNSSFRQSFTTTAITPNVFSYVVAVFSNTTSLWRIFINGVEASYSSQATGNGTNVTDVDPSNIGSLPFNDFAGIIFGKMDEVRISNSVRNDDWIKTEYNNQLSPQTFSTIGPETTNTVTVTPGSNRGLLIQGGKFMIQGGRVTVQ